MRLDTKNEVTHFYARGPSLSGRYTVWGYKPSADLKDIYVGSTDSAGNASLIISKLNTALQLLNEAEAIRHNTQIQPSNLI